MPAVPEPGDDRDWGQEVAWSYRLCPGSGAALTLSHFRMSHFITQSAPNIRHQLPETEQNKMPHPSPGCSHLLSVLITEMEAGKSEEKAAEGSPHLLAAALTSQGSGPTETLGA